MSAEPPKLPKGVHFFSVPSAGRLFLGYAGELQRKADFGRFLASANGSFVNGNSSAGLLIVNGQIKANGLALTGQRGFVAVVRGKIVIGRMNLAQLCASLATPPKDTSTQAQRDLVAKINGPAFNSYTEQNIRAAMNKLFGEMPTSLMSGAMLLRQSNMPFDMGKDLFEQQCFRQSGGNIVEEPPAGFISGQFGSAENDHILVGQTFTGNTTLVIAVQSSRSDILSKCSGLPTLLKLDGGKQFFAHAVINNKQYSTVNGRHPLAIGILK